MDSHHNKNQDPPKTSRSRGCTRDYHQWSRCMKSTIISKLRTRTAFVSLLIGVATLAAASSQAFAQQQKRPNVVMLMSDDVGWGDYGVYYGGAALGHPTPNIDRLAKDQYPNKKRFPGGASNDMLPNLGESGKSAALRSDEGAEDRRSALRR